MKIMKQNPAKRLYVSSAMLVALLFLPAQSNAAELLLQYTFGGGTDHNLNPTISAGFEDSLTASTIARGSPFTGSTSNNNNSSNSSGGTYFMRVGALNEESPPRLLGETESYALTNGTNIEFTLAPQAGYALNLASFSTQIAAEANGTPAPFSVHLFLRSSLDDYASNLATASASLPASGSWANSGWQGASADLSSAFVDLDHSVTFRLYAYAETVDPTFLQIIRIGHIQVEGAVIPEPATWAVMLGSMTFLLAVLARVRRFNRERRSRDTSGL